MELGKYRLFRNPATEEFYFREPFLARYSPLAGFLSVAAPVETRMRVAF
jgi:hypothetical protein